MYAKLVFRNAKRSVKDYLVYIVTMTIPLSLNKVLMNTGDTDRNKGYRII